MFYYNKLEEVIFNFHDCLSEEPDELIIISGFLGPSPVERLSELPFKSTVIGGMYTKGIDARLLGALRKAKESNKRLSLSFTKTEVHSKIYMWRKKGKILTALVGSANFSSNGLRTDLRESLAQANRGTFEMMESYLNIIEDNTVKEPPLLGRHEIVDYTTNKKISVDDLNLKLSCDLPLYSKSKKDVKIVYPKSGLNWGLSSGHVAEGDAYIAIPKEILSRNQGIFKPFNDDYENMQSGKKRSSDPIELIWDDGVTMEASLEGQQNGPSGLVYPKQLASYSLKKPHLLDGTPISAKSILGRYLRNRLGVDVNHEITYEDLQRYGRDYVTISLIEEGVYYCDYAK